MKYSLPSECESLLNSFTLGLVRPTACRISLYCKVYCWIAFYILENILFILLDDVIVMESNGSYWELEKVGDIEMSDTFSNVSDT